MKELEYLMGAGMISVDNDDIEFVVQALKNNGFNVEE